MSIAELEGAQKDELAVSLATLLLHDSGVEVSAENLDAALKAAGVEVAPYWASLFASLVAKVPDVDALLAGPSAGAAVAGGAPASGAAAGGAAAPAEKEEEEEEADLGGGMDMFGGGEDADY